MKIDMQRALAEELLTQIAALRDMEREKRGDTTEWDKSPLGLFFSMLTVELKRRSESCSSGQSQKGQDEVH